MNSRKKWLVIELIIYIVVALSLITLFMGLIDGRNGRNERENHGFWGWEVFPWNWEWTNDIVVGVDVGGKTRLVDNIEVNEENVDKIKISLVSEDVSVLTHDSNTVKIEVYSNADTYYPKISQEGKVLRVEQQKKIVGVNLSRGYVTVYVPEDKMFDYDFNLVSGDVEGYTNGDVRVNNVSGEVEIYGPVSLVDVNTVSGNVNVEAYTMPSGGITVNGVSSDLTVSLPENDGFSVSGSSISGDYENEFTGTSSSKKISEQYKSGGPKIKIDSVSGDLEIVRNGR